MKTAILRFSLVVMLVALAPQAGYSKNEDLIESLKIFVAKIDWELAELDTAWNRDMATVKYYTRNGRVPLKAGSKEHLACIAINQRIAHTVLEGRRLEQRKKEILITLASLEAGRNSPPAREVPKTTPKRPSPGPTPSGKGQTAQANKKAGTAKTEPAKQAAPILPQATSSTSSAESMNVLPEATVQELLVERRGTEFCQVLELEFLEGRLAEINSSFSAGLEAAATSSQPHEDLEAKKLELRTVLATLATPEQCPYWNSVTSLSAKLADSAANFAKKAEVSRFSKAHYMRMLTEIGPLQARIETLQAGLQEFKGKVADSEVKIADWLELYRSVSEIKGEQAAKDALLKILKDRRNPQKKSPSRSK